MSIAAGRPIEAAPRTVRQGGAAAIEFALIATVLLLVFLAIVSYAALFWAQQRISFAAGEGARAVFEGSLAGLVDPQAGCLRATQAAGPLDVSCEPRRQDCGWSGGAGDCVAIVVSYETARWPLAGVLSQVGGLIAADATQWVPEHIRARAIVQVNTDAFP